MLKSFNPPANFSKSGILQIYLPPTVFSAAFSALNSIPARDRQNLDALKQDIRAIENAASSQGKSLSAAQKTLMNKAIQTRFSSVVVQIFHDHSHNVKELRPSLLSALSFAKSRHLDHMPLFQTEFCALIKAETEKYSYYNHNLETSLESILACSRICETPVSEEARNLILNKITESISNIFIDQECDIKTIETRLMPILAFAKTHDFNVTEVIQFAFGNLADFVAENYKNNAETLKLEMGKLCLVSKNCGIPLTKKTKDAIADTVLKITKDLWDEVRAKPEAATGTLNAFQSDAARIDNNELTKAYNFCRQVETSYNFLTKTKKLFAELGMAKEIASFEWDYIKSATIAGGLWLRLINHESENSSSAWLINSKNRATALLEQTSCVLDQANYGYTARNWDGAEGLKTRAAVSMPNIMLDMAFKSNCETGLQKTLANEIIRAIAQLAPSA